MPYRAQCSSTVKVRGFPLQMDVQGFNCFPSRMVGLHMLDCCCFPVHLVLFGPCVYCDAVLHIVSLHCSSSYQYIEKKGALATTSIFRKKTHTDRYMNYDSHHHARIKSSIIKCLGTRAKNVCHATKLIGERNHLKQVFQANGYPAQMVNRTLRNRPHAPHSSTQTEEQTTPPKFLHLPYVRGVSERIQRKCRHLGIRTTFKSKGTLREALVQTKDPQAEWKKKGVCTRYHALNVREH